MSLEERVSKLESLMPLDFADYPVDVLTGYYISRNTGLLVEQSVSEVVFYNTRQEKDGELLQGLMAQASLSLFITMRTMKLLGRSMMEIQV